MRRSGKRDTIASAVVFKPYRRRSVSSPYKRSLPRDDPLDFIATLYTPVVETTSLDDASEKEKKTAD